MPAPLSKGISVWAVVIVIIFGIGIFVFFIVLGGYLNIQNCELAAAACTNKQSAYCLDWWKNDQSLTSGQPAWTAINDCRDGKLVTNGCTQPLSAACEAMLSIGG